MFPTLFQQNHKGIKLYGADHCHKTNYYMQVMDELGLEYEFADVEEHDHLADELRSLYINNRLNFPTFLIDHKKLRNPRSHELIKWLSKLGHLPADYLEKQEEENNNK